MMGRSSDKSLVVKDWPEGIGMIYFGMSQWAGMWKSRHQLMHRFSKQVPVLYVEPWVGLRSLRTGKTKLSRLLEDWRNPNPLNFDSNLYVFQSPAYFPVSRSSVVGKITQKLWLASVHRAARSIGIKFPIVWISLPEMGFVIGKLGELISIYHVVDEYAGYTGLDFHSIDRLRAAEDRVLDDANLIIVASPELQSAKAGPGRDLLVVENGVEPSEYERALATGQEPDDLKTVPKPRIGYSGVKGKRIDLGLLTLIALRNPEWSIVLIGKVDDRECEVALENLRSMKNVYFLGEKNPNRVASYIAGLDVGLLPYAINTETKHISPIKMYEYWAAGKPVVATAIPAACRNKNAVQVAGNREEFSTLISEALTGFTALDRNRLIALARMNSWQSRVDRIAEELSARLGDGCKQSLGSHPRDSMQVSGRGRSSVES